MNIGEEQRGIEVHPVVEPVPVVEPLPEREPVPVREREGEEVPA